MKKRANSMITKKLLSIIDLQPGTDTEKCEKIGIDQSKYSKLKKSDLEVRVDQFAKMAKFLQLNPVQIYEVLYNEQPEEEKRIVRADDGVEVQFLREQLKTCLEINKNLSKRGIE